MSATSSAPFDLEAFTRKVHLLPVNEAPDWRAVQRGRRGRPTPRADLYEKLRPLVRTLLVEKRQTVAQAARLLIAELQASKSEACRWQEFVRGVAQQCGLAAKRRPRSSTARRLIAAQPAN